MTFNPIRTPVDYVIIAGQRSPGVATVRGITSPRRLVDRSGYGLSGATTRFAGRGLAEPTIEIRLWTEEHFDQWETFRQIVAAPPLGQSARALEAEHPQFAAANIRAVLIKDVKEPELEDETGKWLAVIECKEFRRPQFQLSAPDGAQAGPEDNLEIKNDELVAEVYRLGQ